MYPPIAAEAEAAGRAVAALGAGGEPAEATGDPQNPPARFEPGGDIEPRPERTTPLIPSIPRAAARWIRPLVPPFVARVIETTTQPLRTARQVFEEVEEITFALRRTHKVTVGSETFDARPAGHSPTAEHRERGNATHRQAEELGGSHRQSASLPGGQKMSGADHWARRRGRAGRS